MHSVLFFPTRTIYKIKNTSYIKIAHADNNSGEKNERKRLSDATKDKTYQRYFYCGYAFSNIMYGGACAEKYISVNSPCYPMKCSAEYERPELYVCGTPFGDQAADRRCYSNGFCQGRRDSTDALNYLRRKAGIEKEML